MVIRSKEWVEKLLNMYEESSIEDQALIIENLEENFQSIKLVINPQSEAYAIIAFLLGPKNVELTDSMVDKIYAEIDTLIGNECPLTKSVEKNRDNSAAIRKGAKQALNLLAEEKAAFLAVIEKKEKTIMESEKNSLAKINENLKTSNIEEKRLKEIWKINHLANSELDKILKEREELLKEYVIDIKRIKSQQVKDINAVNSHFASL